MLLKGLNHVAVITNNASRLNDFYRTSSTPRSSATEPSPPAATARASPSSRSATGPSSTSSR